MEHFKAKFWQTHRSDLARLILTQAFTLKRNKQTSGDDCWWHIGEKIFGMLLLRLNEIEKIRVINISHEAEVGGFTSFVSGRVLLDLSAFNHIVCIQIMVQNVWNGAISCRGYFFFFFFFFPSEIQRGKTLRYKSATKKTIWPEALGKNWWINLSYVWDHVWRPPIPWAGGCDPFASRPALLSTSVQDTARSGSLKLLGVFLMDSTHTHAHRHTRTHTHRCATHFSLTHSMLEMTFNNFPLHVYGRKYNHELSARTCEHTHCIALISPLNSHFYCPFNPQCVSPTMKPSSGFTSLNCLIAFTYDQLMLKPSMNFSSD